MMASNSVTVINYGIGNLLSATRALASVGADVKLIDDPQQMEKADRVILPGVGAFGKCIDALTQAGFRDAVLHHIRKGKPLLGICVGMQMLFDASEEFDSGGGLGVLAGRVKRIPAADVSGRPQKVPHIGWTPLQRANGNDTPWRNSILSDIPERAAVYFVHSYTAWPEIESDRVADAFHGGQRISAMVERDNVIGVQFHPEKSGPVGLSILQNFVGN